MSADQTNIKNLLPQRPPVVLIDKLVTASDHTAVTRFVVQPDHIFVAKGFLTESGLIENIAQTAAAHAGYMQQSSDVPAAIGFIGAIKDLVVHDLPEVGCELETTVVIVNRVMDVTIISGVVRHNERELCRCEMKMYIQK